MAVKTVRPVGRSVLTAVRFFGVPLSREVVELSPYKHNITRMNIDDIRQMEAWERERDLLFQAYLKANEEATRLREQFDAWEESLAWEEYNLSLEKQKEGV